jgi:hypothetical protein
MADNTTTVVVDGLPVEVDSNAWNRDRKKVEDAVRGEREALKVLDGDEAEDYTARVGHDG